MLEDDRAVAIEMLREASSIAVCEQPFELPLALFERRRPQILAVQLDQIESVEEDARVMRARVQRVEIWLAVPPAPHGLAVDRDRARAKRAQRLEMRG